MHVFAEAFSPVFRSRHCHRGFSSPPWTEGPAFLANLDRVVDAGAYDAIYVASEPILHLLARRPRTGPWLALPLPPPATLDVFLSKHRIVRRVAESEAPVPRTIVPETDRDLEEAGRELGFPILVKGEHGTASAHVRLCRDRAALRATYATMLARERRFGGRPALQEYVAGPKYTLSGLFRDGVALRIVGYRALLTCPPETGETVKLVTEAPPGFRETALGAFEALGHTGIGSAEFLLDSRDGRFKFIDFAPRLWGNIGVAEFSGVDLFGPYQALARDDPVRPDLRYATGVVYRRPSGVARRLTMRPADLAVFLRDSVDRRVRSDFAWSDPWPHLPSVSWLRRAR